MNLRNALVIIGVLIFKCESRRPPHIIFIVADDLGWNDVGWHNPKMHTPNLNYLAYHGVILNSSYVQPMCTPSRSCFMTGRYPFHTGMQDGVIKPLEPDFLPTNFETLPEKLRPLGYSTHIIGKWHLGYCKWKYTPTYRGFDSFFGFYSGSEHYYTHMSEYRYDFRFNTSVWHPPENKYSTDLYTDRVIDILNSVNPETESLYLYIAFQSVHSPLEVPAKYEKLYPDLSPSGRKTYCGMVSALDEAVGKIHDALIDKGFMENALLVFTTDNGGNTFRGASNVPLRGEKGSLWEGGTKGVAFAYSDILLKKTRYVNNEIIHAVDWFPTLLSLAGGIPDPSLDGVNQWQTISEGARSSRIEFVYNINEIANVSAIRVGKYKLIQGKLGYSWCRWKYPQPEFRLFDLEKDPFEQDNIAEQLKHTVKKLKDRLDFHRKTIVPASHGSHHALADPKLFDRENLSPGWC